MRNFRTVDQDGKVVEPPKPVEEVVAKDPSSDAELLRLKKLLEEMQKTEPRRYGAGGLGGIPIDPAPAGSGTFAGIQITTSPYLPPGTIYYVNTTGPWPWDGAGPSTSSVITGIAPPKGY